MTERLKLKIFGKVQGVFFRYHTKNQAQRLGLVGWIKNEEDGTVLIEVEGPEEKVREFVFWCYKGPVDAKVKQIQKIKLRPKKEEKDFIIISSLKSSS